MRFPEFQPLIELVAGDRKTFAEFFDGRQAGEELCKDTENEEQAVTGIGDNKIRKDSVGMATATDQAEDADIAPDRPSLNKIYDPAPVISMNTAVSFGTTDGAGFQFGTERGHIGIKQNF